MQNTVQERIWTPDWGTEYRHAGRAGAADWWDPNGDGLCIVAAYQPKDAATYAASKTNLANPGVDDATEGVAPDWDAVNGWKFNGIDDYLIGPDPGVNTLGYSLVLRFSNGGSGFAFLAGFGNVSSQRFSLRPNNSNKVDYYNNSSASIAPGLTSGVLAICGAIGYRNGVQDAVGLTGFNSTLNFYIGCENWKGVALRFLVCYVQAAAFYNCALTGPQILAVSTAMAAL